MSQFEFPSTPAELSPERLTVYLQESGAIADRVNVRDVDYSLIGHGKMGANARLRLSYSGPAQGAPATIVGKFPAEDARAREMAGAQGAYYKEVMFYRELAPATPMKTPRIYASELSDDRKGFLLLMEDISDASAGNNLEGASREHTTLAAREAAKLAASFYGDETLGGRDYVMSPAREDGGAMAQALMEQCWPGFVDRFQAALSAEAREFGEDYIGRHTIFATRYTGPKTLIHGDFRSENILFGVDTATAVDWQTASESSPLADLAYFMGGSVETGDRRQWEREMVAYFRGVLADHGLELPESDCWDQYREYSMHGLMIMILGASFSSPDPRADAMFSAMIRRHVQHCLDLGAGEFLG
ncbi:phosphotransferase [Parahaliea maris]|uniref:Phosphotransferase n=1 Tax=Parahaliea maris TaxID=2716870 RepID=A0A5C9AA13_9GAMM|nr:phosphotransferase [Parahaliea maris]TXS96121.1 phosphotransferase [Parahaliea maris]